MSPPTSPASLLDKPPAQWLLTRVTPTVPLSCGAQQDLPINVSDPSDLSCLQLSSNSHLLSQSRKSGRKERLGGSVG